MKKVSIQVWSVKKRYILMILACVAAALSHTSAWAGTAEGKSAFAAKCASCHQITGPGKAIDAAKRSGIKGPPLWFAGSKFKAEWLTAWLQKPAPIRRVKFGTLKAGANAHAATAGADDIAAYLMSLKDSSVQAGVVPAKKLGRRKVMKAVKLFTKKQVCFGCHEYPFKGKHIGGFTGPSLVGAGARLQADWIYAFMQDPLHFYPNGRMPVYGDKADHKFGDKELKLLAQYIGGME